MKKDSALTNTCVYSSGNKHFHGGYIQYNLQNQSEDCGRFCYLFSKISYNLDGFYNIIHYYLNNLLSYVNHN